MDALQILSHDHVRTHIAQLQAEATGNRSARRVLSARRRERFATTRGALARLTGRLAPAPEPVCCT